MMRRLISFLALISVVGLRAFAQDAASGNFEDRYNALVSAVGTAGVGVETLLDKWEAAEPDNSKMFEARFLFYLTKCRTEQVKPFDKNRYLGQEPILSLKDSLGNPVNYFRDTDYDDEIFGNAIKAIDKAIQKNPINLDLRLAKISAFVGYEKESPDIATSELKGLIDYSFTQSPKWVYPGIDVNAEFFAAMVQQYCATFFKYGTPASYKAFKELSQKMLTYEPGNTVFMDNMGSYYLVVEKDSKTALKYYNKVLKKKPDDITAITNCVLLARNDKNIKLEKKYLPKLIEYSEDENTRKAATVRLEALNK